MTALIEDGERLLSAYSGNTTINQEPTNKAQIKPALRIKITKKGNSFVILSDGNGWNTFAISATIAYEYNPTIVQIGNEDTLFAGLNVYSCSVL
jgi:hypothetical protein